MEIGSHGLRPVSLTSIDGGGALTADGLAAEVSGSRAILQEVSGQEVSGFCYPYGHVDAVAGDAVRAAGYRYGCAIWPSPLTGLHTLPRTYIGDRLVGRLALRGRQPTLFQPTAHVISTATAGRGSRFATRQRARRSPGNASRRAGPT